MNGDYTLSKGKLKATSPYVIFQDYASPDKTPSEKTQADSTPLEKRSNHERVLEMIQKRKVEREQNAFAKQYIKAIVNVDTTCPTKETKQKGETRNITLEKEKTAPKPKLTDIEFDKSEVQMSPHSLTRAEIEDYKRKFQERALLFKKNQSSARSTSGISFSSPRPISYYQSLAEKVAKSQNSLKNTSKSFIPDSNRSCSSPKILGLSSVYENRTWNEMVSAISKKLSQTKLLQLRSKFMTPERLKAPATLLARNNQWVNNKNQKLQQKRIEKKANELLGCTFSPRTYSNKLVKSSLRPTYMLNNTKAKR